MDIKHVFSINPLLPAYQAPQPQIAAPAAAARLGRVRRRAGRDRSSAAPASPSTTRRRGTRSGSNRFALRRGRSTCGEFLEFIADGGYRRPEFWLSDGWATVAAQGWEAPLYWRREA